MEIHVGEVRYVTVSPTQSRSAMGADKRRGVAPPPPPPGGGGEGLPGMTEQVRILIICIAIDYLKSMCGRDTRSSASCTCATGATVAALRSDVANVFSSLAAV